MGHRKTRKADRRARREQRGGVNMLLPGLPGDDGLTDASTQWDQGPTRLLTAPAATTVCGRCREFVEDPEGGRGTCLHPGSGVLSPWTDTPSCDFYHGPRR